jgi:endo-1,4-beta-D-glucanase Y
MDSVVRNFYNAWKARYVITTAGNQAYVKAQTWQPDAVSVSEGHGYGMVITALMAGHDAGAQTTFDNMYRFFRAHPASNPQLMGWYQKLSGGSVVDGSKWNATDGDLDVAFSLLLADAQWGSAGAINYLAQARAVIAAIMQSDINRSYWFTLRGDTGQSDMSSRTSDYMLDHFRAFQRATGDANWAKVVSKLQSILSSMQASKSPGTGLAPDFVQSAGTSPTPAAPSAFESAYDGQHYWNACRVPWRIGTDMVLTGDASDATILARMNTFIRNKTGGSPGNIAAGYYLNGSVIDQWATMAFIAPFGVAAMASAENQTWLNRLWDYIAGPGLVGDYYGDAIRMQVLLVMSGNWWIPGQPASPPPPPPATGLPSPWLTRDIGAVGASGSATALSGVFTVKGAGQDIWGSADEFRYVYQTLSGDGEIIARVRSVQNTHPWAQAGVMIRESLAANARHAFMLVSAQSGADLAYRTQTGGSTAEVYQGNTGAAPLWLRLVRSGSRLTGYRSTDGIKWVQQGSVSVSMASTAYIGLAVSSLSDPTLNTSVFDSIRVVP